MDDDMLPRKQGDAASALAKEDLSPYSVDELDQRLELLRAEINRVEAHKAKATDHRRAADALFGGGAKD